jgi:RHS repeat-associated protein
VRLTLDATTSRADALGQPTEAARPRADRTAASSRLQRLIDADQRARTVVSGEAGTREVHERGGGRSGYRFDAGGDLRRLMETNGATTTFRYDPRRRLTDVRHPDGIATRYAYGPDDRLRTVDDRGAHTVFEHDSGGRLTRACYGAGLQREYRYDGSGRLIEGRTPSVATAQRFDDTRRVVEVRQTLDGVTVAARLEYDHAGRLTAVHPPGDTPAICYRWDTSGRMQAAVLGDEPIIEFDHGEATLRAHLGNGLVDERAGDPVDGRPLRQRLMRGSRVLFARDLVYDNDRVVADGTLRYRYDALGRLVAADDRDGNAWCYRYDPRDNRSRATVGNSDVRYRYDRVGRLAEARHADGSAERWEHDRWGRPRRCTGPRGRRRYRYDGAGQLVAIEHDGRVTASFDYDHYGRLAGAVRHGRVERYLYGPDGALVAVADRHGRCLRVPVRTPLGVLAEVVAATGAVRYLHGDHQGSVHLVTDGEGELVAEVAYDPFGAPLRGGPAHARFCGHPYFPEIGLYWLGSRWYDPLLGRFLTPDSYTGAPDDARLVEPGSPASAQAQRRAIALDGWLTHPRVRNRYAYCGNDPVGSVDPDGHWAFGGALLSMLGAVWTLPNTMLGLLIEVGCLALEVVRWLAWVLSLGRVTWAPPGLDVAASPRLNTAAVVFRGGAVGSFPQLFHGMALGNVFFVYGGWQDLPQYSGPGDVFPDAYGGAVAIPRDRALYEHELRHVNQYGWLGPFFLPAYGFEVLLLSGYDDSVFEQDARRHAGV